MRRIMVIILSLVFLPGIVMASFPEVPDDVTAVRVSKSDGTTDFYVWAQDGSLYLHAVPVEAGMSMYGGEFVVIQDQVQYSFLELQSEEEIAGVHLPFCCRVFVPVTIRIDCPWYVDVATGCFNAENPLTLVFSGNENYYIDITPISPPPPPPESLGKSGWWWNPNQEGRGIAIEIQGNKLFMAWYAYDEATGEPTWVSSAGTMSDANNYTGTMWKYKNGQCIGCPYKSPDPAENVGSVSITFHSNTTATLTYQDITLNLQRFEFGTP
jgi:hypothetical protein